ncbi:hypothetical protein RYX56_12770 [Alkalihalophilus lindianensis]|uniref:Uncharacterized protein n=1 Tax=Alkalihalophilus lindianensis TaxID=1630542 RepID=A0ABU3XBK5_9BACI|nr:hypothetical protein [Alkalihalophilus lindianensis]MDV2685228.1 hypothetical protein [Alkalihalophilus lindianensis]
MLYSDEQLYDYICGLVACRYTYGTTILQSSTDTHVQHGYPISNRIHEFFVKQDHLQDFLQQPIPTEHWLTIISSSSIPPIIPGYQFQTNEFLMDLETNEDLPSSHKYSHVSTKIEQVTSYIEAQEINTHFQVKAINLEQLE